MDLFLSKNTWQSILPIAFLLLCVVRSQGQDLYKTPSGKKYHLASCRMVVNVSKKLINNDDLANSNLQPCKICNPPARQSLVNNDSGNNKAVGESASVQCHGYTQAGTRCAHKTRIANGYCYQHTSQYKAEPSIDNLRSQQTTASICGAKTKAGGPCQRKVTGSGRCYQHQ